MQLRKNGLTSLLMLTLTITPSYAAGFQVARIHDGDTLTLTTGEKIRLLQIDTPEISPAECYGTEALKALIKIIGKTPITLQADPVSADKDQFGRTLRYVIAGDVNVNLKLVAIGAATPYFFNGERGKLNKQLLEAAKNARSKKLGLWRTCPSTKLNSSKPANTGPVVTPSDLTKKSSSMSKCDPNYQGCIPQYPPDLDCSDIKKMGLAPIRVIGIDNHKLDNDGDGIGCDH